MKSENAGSNTNKSSLIKSGVSAVICLLVLIICCISMAWFDYSRDFAAKAASVSVANFKQLSVSREHNGEDISKENLKFHITPAEGTQVEPGSNGSFNMFLKYSDVGSVKFSYNLSAYDGGEALPPFKIGDETKQQNALRFASTHIACFSNYDSASDTYSGWIGPDSGLTIPFEEKNTEKEVTIYWIWIESYDTILNANNQGSHINIADLNRIIASVDSNPELWLDPRTSTLENLTNRYKYAFYNFADEDIGSVINNFCIDVTLDNYE